jgi:hypothetical protein
MKEQSAVVINLPEADDLTGCTLDELMESLPTLERLAEVAAHMERLERICECSKSVMTPEGAANKAVVYAFMQSSINEAAWAALALRQLLPLIRTLSQPREAEETSRAMPPARRSGRRGRR